MYTCIHITTTLFNFLCSYGAYFKYPVLVEVYDHDNGKFILALHIMTIIHVHIYFILFILMTHEATFPWVRFLAGYLLGSSVPIGVAMI